MALGPTSTFMIAAAACLGPIAAGAESVGIIPNLGQIDPTVRYYARSDGAVAYFTDQAIVIDLTDRGQAVWIRLAEISDEARFEPIGERLARLHFFLGSDPERWTTDVPMYDALVYRQIATGVDLWLRVGGDAVHFELHGDASQMITAQDLVRSIEPAGSPVTLDTRTDAPRAGELRWQPDAGGAPPGPDPAEDPATLTYSTYLGGTLNDRAHALTFDVDGNPVVGGYSQSHAFPATPGSYDPTHNGGYDAFLSKFSADGSTLLWATYVGGSLEDRAFTVHRTSDGNFVFSGQTYSDNFPTTAFSYDRTFGGIRDGYAAKLSASGSLLLWSTYIGGEKEDRVWDMDLNDEDAPILAGNTGSADFPTTAGAFDETFNGTVIAGDGFVMKLAPNGRSLIWSTFLGSTATDYVKFMALGPDQQPLLFGSTTSSGFPTTPGAYDETPNGSDDCFVTKLDATGSFLVYSTFLGGALSDLGEVIEAHSSGDVVVTGATTSIDFPTTEGAFDRSANGGKDAFLTRLSANGDSLVYSTYFGGGGADEPWALTLDHDGGPIFSGYVQSVNFPTTENAYDRTHNGLQDTNITQLDPSGSAMRYSTYFGGSDLDGGWELALDASGNPVLTGPTGSPDFPTTPGAYDRSHNGGRDVFLARFDIANPSSAPDEPGVAGTLRVGPNPFSQAIEIRLHLAQSDPVRVLVLDAMGRRLETLRAEPMGSGAHSFRWEGTDAHGRQLPAGVYWVRAEVPGRRDSAAASVLAQRKVILVR